MRRRLSKAATAKLEVEEKKVDEAAARRSALAAVAGKFKSFRPAAETLTRVRSVPTIFPGLNHATGVRGFPLERLTLVHGPSGGGKSRLTLGIVKSFLRLDHFALFIDAERTTPREWVEEILGPHAEHPGFFYDRPSTYEATVKGVRAWANEVKTFRDAGKVPEDTCGVMVLDSIRKLVPEDVYKKIMSEAKAPDEKIRDRSAQLKAAANAQWMDELIPLLEKTNTAMVIIARETEDPNADFASVKYGTNFKVGGGKALFYDASLVMRVEMQRHVAKDKGEGTARPIVYGERHRVTIHKTKVSGQEEGDRRTVFYFHHSNGLLVPKGFDRARDVLELARRFGVVKGDSWLSWGARKLGQGEHKAVEKLAVDGALLDALEAEVAEHYRSVRPARETPNGDVTEDGEVLS